MSAVGRAGHVLQAVLRHTALADRDRYLPARLSSPTIVITAGSPQVCSVHSPAPARDCAEWSRASKGWADTTVYLATRDTVAVWSADVLRTARLDVCLTETRAPVVGRNAIRV
jgi:hypothetical protein